MRRVVYRFICFGCLGLLLSACESGSDNAAAKATEQYSDMDIAAALFSDQRVPAGFYSEQLPNDAYYTIYHINRSHLPGFTGGYKYAMCSNDFDEALIWSEQAANAQPQYRELVDNRNTEVFFEFIRSSSSSPQIIHLQRVYKCSFVQPRLQVEGQDVLAQNLTLQQVRRYIEYRWLFSAANNTGNSVVSVTSASLNGLRKVELLHAQWLIGMDDECELIKLNRYDSFVDEISGELSQSQIYLREFFAKRDYSGAQPCDKN